MVEVIHQPAPRTVAERSGDAPKPTPGAPSKPGPARPTPGNANAPVKPLRDIKSDPSRALNEDIDNGLRDIRSGKLIAGRIRIADGIREVVKKLNGKDRATYAEAKRATDKILVAYSRRPRADVKEVVDGVNNRLQAIVIEGLANAKQLGGGDPLMEALDTAKIYVTDAGPHSRARLKSMINTLKDADFGPLLTETIEKECEEAIRSKR
jgi:hypothetical protein